MQNLRQPHHLGTGEETDDEGGFLRPGGPSCRLSGSFDLQQSEPCVIEEDSSGWSEDDAPSPALQQLHADLRFKITDLPAQGWLRGVQSPLCGVGEASFFGYCDEIT